MTAIFRISQDGVVGTYGRARDDIAIYDMAGTVTFEAQDAAETSYLWELYSQPAGVSETVTNSTTNTATVDFTVTGGYLMRLTTDAGLATEDVRVLYVGLPLEHSNLPIPALGELDFDNSKTPFDGSYGTAQKMEAWFRWLDAQVGEGITRHRSVLDLVDCTAAPPTTNEHDRYILDNTGAVHADWDGAANWDIVELIDATWHAVTPEEGDIAYVDAEDLDYRYVDDGAPQWEIATGIGVFEPGTGFGSAQRTNNMLTTEGTAAFNMGALSIINVNSDFSASFGFNNYLGATGGDSAPMSFVMGYDNEVYDGLTGVGESTVFGAENNIYGSQCTVFGDDNAISNTALGIYILGGRYDYGGVTLSGNEVGENGYVMGSCIIGAGNVIDSAGGFLPYTIGAGIFGVNNTLGAVGSDFFTYVFGTGNSVDSSMYAYVFGTLNNIDSALGAAVIGDGNALDTVNNCMVVGADNYAEVDLSLIFGDGNALYVGANDSVVFGVDCTTYGRKTFIHGEDNLINAGSLYNQIFGGADGTMGTNGNVIGVTGGSVCYSVIFGDGNRLDCVTAPYSGYVHVAGSTNDVGLSSGCIFTNVFGAVNSVNDAFSTDVRGLYNVVSGQETMVFGGSNYVIDSNSCFVFGTNHYATGVDRCIVNGWLGSPRWSNSIVNASGQYLSGNVGDGQVIVDVPLWNNTTTGTWSLLYIDGDVETQQLTTVTNGAYALQIMILAHQNDDGYCKSWVVEALALNNGDTLTILDSTKNVIGQTDSSNEDDWDVRVTADDVNDIIQIEVVGENGVDIHWHATVRCIELIRYGLPM